MGGIVCETCDPPPPGYVPPIRLAAANGTWDDADNPWDPAVASAGLVGGQAAVRVAVTRPPPRPLPPGVIPGPEAALAIGRLAAEVRMHPVDWLDAMSAVFTDREAEFGWSAVPTSVVIAELREAQATLFPPPEPKKAEGSRKKPN